MNTARWEVSSWTSREWVNIALVLASSVVLLIDKNSSLGGQWAVSLFVWLIFFRILKTSPSEWRLPLFICLIIATLGEAFFSLIWGLYTYRLHNIPFFVPPGHVLIFYLGLVLAPRIPKIFISLVLFAAILYSAVAWIKNFDTISVPLLGIFLLYCWLCPKDRRLAAVMFIISLTLELYGTWMGSWVWHPKVPYLGLSSGNPPIIAGAFYCSLDMLVGFTVLIIQKINSREK